MPTFDLPERARVLVLKPRGIGDVVLCTPLLRALRAARPRGTTRVATDPACAPVLEGNPHVDEVWTWPRTAAGTVALVRRARAARLDCVLDAFGNPRSALVAWLSGARVRVGYDVRMRRHAYDVVVKRLPAGHYNARVQLELAAAVGAPPAGDRPQLFLRADERAWAKRCLQEIGASSADRVVGVNPGGSWTTKRWWSSRFGALARRLAEERGAFVAILWGPGEEAAAQEVQATAAHARVRAVPACSLRQMAALIETMRVLVTNDAAAKHLAVALGTPSVTLHGPTDPRAWHPPEGGRHRVVVGVVPCGPCERTACGHRSCMVKITVPEVAREASDLLGGR